MNISNSSYTEILEIKDLCGLASTKRSPLLKDQLFSTWNSKNLKVRVSLQELDMSTTKCLFDAFRLIGLKLETGANVSINWHYDEDNKDIYEVGEDYSDLFELPFEFVERNN